MVIYKAVSDYFLDIQCIFETLEEGVRNIENDPTTYPKIEFAKHYVDNSHIYDIYQLGDYNIHYNKINNGWYYMSGLPILEIPIVKKIRTLMGSYGIDSMSSVFMLKKGEKKMHIDTEKKSCGLNFLFYTIDARTIIEDEGNFVCYNTIAGDVWLIDHTKPHRIQIRDGSTRKWLQIIFKEDFDKVVEIFKRHRPLSD